MAVSLVRLQADVTVQHDHDVETPLMMVAAKGAVDYVEMLLDAKADACTTVSDGSAVWSLAVEHGQPAVLHCLLSRGLNPDQCRGCDGETVLLQAVRSGSLQVVRSLLQGGVNAHGADDSGITPLMEAVRLGSEDTIQCLLNAMADVNRRNATGQTPLRMAFCSNQVEALHMMLRARNRCMACGNGNVEV
eukprot:s4420_g9.t1